MQRTILHGSAWQYSDTTASQLPVHACPLPSQHLLEAICQSNTNPPRRTTNKLPTHNAGYIFSKHIDNVPFLIFVLLYRRISSIIILSTLLLVVSGVKICQFIYCRVILNICFPLILYYIFWSIYCSNLLKSMKMINCHNPWPPLYILNLIHIYHDTLFSLQTPLSPS